MTPDCLRLDDYLDGRLSESESETFETHTATCADCDAALDDALALDGLATLRDVTCPPAVVTAALRQARRAPDRAAVPIARRSTSRLSLVVLALAAAVALVVGLTRLDASDTPRVAEVVPPDLAPAEAPAPDPEPAPFADDDTKAEAPAPGPAFEPSPTPQPAPAPPAVAPPAPAPREVMMAPEDAVAQADGTLDESPEAAPTPEEIADAQRDLALAFSLIAEAQTRAGDALRSRTGSMSATIDQALPF